MSDWKALVKNKQEWGNLKYDDPRLDAFAKEVESRYGLPPNMLVALKNAGERTNPGQVSPKGAKGIMQFMPKEAKQFAHDVSDPFASIDAAGRYMQELIKENTKRFENLYGKEAMKPSKIYKAAIANYNGGPTQAKKVLQGEEPTAEETKNYLDRIMNYLNENAK